MRSTVNYDSPQDLRRELEERGLSMQKRFGQNFLINPGARKKLVDLLEPEEGGRVWEIGPGLGAMTRILLERKLNLTLFEIDRGFAAALRDYFGGEAGFRLVEGDFLKTWPQEAAAGPPAAILGNLPYNSGSPMIAELVKWERGPGVMVFTLQKEVARRITARPGDSLFSSFTLLCQGRYRAEYCGELKPGSFYPAPDVVSAMIRLTPNGWAWPGESFTLYAALTEQLFRARRKTIRNNINASPLPALWGKDRIWDSCRASGIDPALRGEALTPEILREWVFRIQEGKSEP